MITETFLLAEEERAIRTRNFRDHGSSDEENA